MCLHYTYSKNFLSDMPEELQFLNDTKYVKHRCKENDPACVEGWTGGDFEEWAPEESMFNANGG